MSKKKLPALSTAPMVKGEPQLQRWLNNVKTILENIDLNASSADVVITDKQIADLVAAKLKGQPGPPGPPGPQGHQGQTSYFHVAYSSAPDGIANFSTTTPNTYIGTYSDFIVTDSSNPSLYLWSKFEGVDGISIVGPSGETSYLHLKYSNDNATFTPDTGQGIGEDIGSYLGQYVDFVLSDSVVFSDYKWAKIEGQAGVSSYFHIAYSDSADGSTNFSTTVQNTYIGVLSDNTQSDSTTYTDYAWSKFVPTDGMPGDAGYIHIKYSNDNAIFTPDTGQGIGEDTGDWIGQYTDNILADSVTFSDYKWAKIKGNEGIPSYVHIAYSDSPDGSTNLSEVIPNIYIGIYTDNIQAGSGVNTDYTWSKLVGDDGIGISGTSSYVHIKYSPDGIVFSPNSGEDADDWMGQYVDDVLADSNNPSDYTWSNLKGPQGSNGLASYFYTAYGNDSAGVDFSLSYSNQSYMGTYTSNSPTQSTNPSDYTWVLFKGADGGGLPQTSVTPTALTGLLAVPTRTFTILVWDPIPLGNDAQHTNIYRNGVDDSTGAQLIGTTKTLIYQDYTSSDGNYYYWISSQSRGSTTTPEGIEGAISGSGVLSAINSKIKSSNAADYFDNGALDYTSYIGGIKPPSNADVTSDNTALAILNQGDFATSSQIDSSNINQLVALGVIGADFIGVAHLAAIKADLGTVTAGRMRNSNGTFDVNLTDKYIEIAGSAGRDLDDYIRIENGKIQQFEWTGVSHQQASSLNTIESGVASNGQTITLLKYYATQPDIIVTAYDTPIYNAASSAQDQSIQIRAENINEVPPGSGTWEFDAISRLVLGANTLSTPINDSVSGSGNLTTPSYFSPVNSTDVTVSVDLTSVRSTTTAGINYLRRATWTIHYRVKNSGTAYTEIPAGISAIGQTIDAIMETQLVTFPSANEYEIYVSCVYEDAGGTWNAGGGGIETNTVTVTAPSAGNFSDVSHSKPNTTSWEIFPYSDYIDMSLPTYTPPVGWTISNITYNATYNYYLKAYGLVGSVQFGTVDGYSEVYLMGGNVVSQSAPTSFVQSAISLAVGTVTNGEFSFLSQTPLSFSYSSQVYTPKVEMTCLQILRGRGQASSRWRGQLQSGSATITIQRPSQSSTIASNILKINTFNYSLSGTTELNTGTLGWQAIL